MEYNYIHCVVINLGTKECMTITFKIEISNLLLWSVKLYMMFLRTINFCIFIKIEEFVIYDSILSEYNFAFN